MSRKKLERTEKACARCHQTFPIEDFYLCKSGKRNAYCKPCALNDMKDRIYRKMLLEIEKQRLIYADLPEDVRPKPKHCPNPRCPRADEIQPPENFRPSPLSADKLSVTCRTCKLVRNRASISSTDKKLFHRLWYQANKEILKQREKEWRIAHPEQVRECYVRRRFRQYGVTPEWYDSTLAEQKGKCAICGTKNPQSPSGTFHVDHDHRCCKKSCNACDKCRRGLLCGPCNTRLGILEKQDWIRKAFAYLREHSQMGLFNDVTYKPRSKRRH